MKSQVEIRGRPRTTLLWVLVLLLGAGAAARAPAATGEPDRTPASPVVVFLTKSDACDCVANLCVAGEQEVLNFVTAHPDRFRLERIDLAERPDEGRRYRAFTLPVAILKDESGRTVARFDAFFTESDLSRAWEAHRAGTGGTP
ncbi:MAG: hypothetical protein Kow0092_14960 [Deferrisomatales bacterium]